MMSYYAALMNMAQSRLGGELFDKNESSLKFSDVSFEYARLPG
jgi:hypothetical protein